jgi:hypothetical protein
MSQLKQSEALGSSNRTPDSPSDLCGHYASDQGGTYQAQQDTSGLPTLHDKKNQTRNQQI